MNLWRVGEQEVGVADAEYISNAQVNGREWLKLCRWLL